MWAVRTLGRFFQRQVVVEPGQTIVRAGPYRRLRHPAYAGDLLSIFGFALMIGSWIGAVAALGIAFAAHVPRIHVEERALRDAFGASYANYARATARLLPYVW